MNKYLFFSFLFFISWMHTYSQNIVKRNPLISKEEANFYWSSDYTLFDFTTDEPIFPILKDGQLIYRIYYASKEDPRPYSGEFNINQLEKLRFLKFKNRETCIKFCLTLKPPLIPKIITLPVNEIIDSVAQSGGNILSDGGSPIISRGIAWSTSPNPTIFLQTKTSNGTGIGIFKSSLTKLKPNTIYFVRAFATNSAGTGYGNEISFTSKPETFTCGSSKVSDIDGNIYQTVQIGMQCWTKENLKVSKYNDGTPVPLDNSGGTPGTGPDETWSFKASGARTIYAHSQENFSAYGYLYNWFAARGIASAGDTNYKNLCPIGWHIPTVEEGFTLSNFLGGYNIAGGKLKSTGTTLWKSPNMSATNMSGFSGLPGGSRINYIGRFESLGSKGFWWFSSGVPDRVDGMSLTFDESSVGLFAGNTEENGHSVRCLKDTLTISMTLTIPSLTTIEADSIKTTSIRSGGNISSDGGCSLTDRGLVWDTSPNPTIVLSTKTWNGSGIGRFTSEITGLNPNTTYYIRAYASNCKGIAYGNEVSLSTASATTIPTLTTTAADSIKTTAARSGGNITSDGGCTITTSGVVWSTSQNPTIALSTKTSDGTGTGSFTSNLTGLIANTTYYVRAYATNCVGTAYGSEVSFTTTAASQGLPCPGVPTVTDIDGNTYNTVQIGTQCWTKENLRVTKYSDGTIIPLDSSGGIVGNGAGETWLNRFTGARTIYAHSQSNLATYGYLYNWYAAKGVATTGSTSYKNLCPTGWHVPSDGEWTNLTTYLGGQSLAGGKMKSTGTSLWESPNEGSTNESGFTVLPGGYRNYGGGFDGIRLSAFFWSATESDGSLALGRSLYVSLGIVNRDNGYKQHGVSVRCLRDSISTSSTTLPTITTTAADSIKTTTARSGGNITSDGGCSITARGVVWSTSQNPTIALSTKTSDGTGTGSFTSNLTGLIANTTYYVRAYATNCVGTAYGSEVTFTTTTASQGLPCPGVPTVTDIDGNTYNTVQIGTQCWTKENLRVTKYSDGTIIPLDSSGGTAGNGAGQTWGSRTIGARTIYAHSQSNLATYGYLYNWYAAKGIATTGSTIYKNLCPAGWHVPSDGEWTNLTTYLGGQSLAGGKMKSTGTTLWAPPNTEATNESGFTVLPGGSRSSEGIFGSIRFRSFFWSATENDNNLAWNSSLNFINGIMYRSNDDSKQDGFSIRCLRDSISTPSTTLPTITTTAADSIKTTTARSGGNITSDGGCSITARGVVWSTSQNPTISLSTKTSDGIGTGSFTSNLTGLIANTTYYVRAYATNCIGTAYGSEVTFTTTSASQEVPCQAVPTVTDIDGNTYNTVQIGTQCWTKENLRVTKYSDGTIIPLDSSGGTAGNGAGQTWGSRTIGARTIYAHSQSNLATYGYLYNWYAAKGVATTGSTSYKNLCPTGWHVPSDGEWTNLTTFLGGESIAGGKMKSTGTTLWASPNTGATNESGFTGLPGGYRIPGGSFDKIRNEASFWSATEDADGNVWNRNLFSNFGHVSRGQWYFKSVGASVRCLRD